VIELEALLARLAREPSPVTADRLLAQALGSSCLLGPAQQALDRLRGDAGKARDVEHLQGGWWRIGGELVRVTEALQGQPLHRPLVLLAGCAGGAGPLWVDPRLPVPAPLLRVAWEATSRGPLALCLPGRVHLAGGVYRLSVRPRQLGRTLEGVQLIDPTGQPAGIGTVVEVGDPDDLQTLSHELGHVLGAISEDEAHRIGALLTRMAARWR
jgi:hypothetical protein